MGKKTNIYRVFAEIVACITFIKHTDCAIKDVDYVLNVEIWL